MIVTCEPITLALPASHGRSKGIHVSNIIRAIAAETGVLKTEVQEDFALTDVREITDPISVLRISMGLAWEEWYIPNVLSQMGVLDHPGEMEVDGVFMTHDGECLDVIITDKRNIQRIVVHEVKATFKSVRTVGDLNSQWMWLAQLKAYCKGKKTRFAVLHVLYVCGDYSFPIGPSIGPLKNKPQVYHIEFTQEEIDSNWSLITEYRDSRIDKE